MHHAIHWIDPAPSLAAGIQPVLFLERPLLHGNKPNGGMFNSATVAREGRYWTPKHSLLAPDPLWTLTCDGQHVHVPVNAYRTEFMGAAGIFQTGLLLGSEVMRQFRIQSREEPLCLHLVLGNDCTPLPNENAYRCYVGFSIQCKD